MPQDFTGTNKRMYLLTSVRQHIDRLDDVELAVVLHWLKSGGIYRETLLATLDPEKLIAKAEEIGREAQRKEEAERVEADAKRAEEKKAKDERARALWKAQIGKK